MPLFLLLLILFWAVVPGLIAGWMLHERGRSFAGGLAVGAVCGPLGILGTLAFVYFSDRRRRRNHGRGRAFRVFYDVPVVGSLHVSTVWALAGLATFLCAWMVGGIAYELYRAEAGDTFDARGVEISPDARAKSQTASGSAAPGAPTPDPKSAANAQSSNTAAQARTALMGNMAAQPAQSGGARADNSSTQTGAPASAAGTSDSLTATARTEERPPASAAPIGPSNTPTPAPAAKSPAQGRESAVAEVTQALSARGHRVHASLSGDAQTSTLSLSGATLTREAGNQILGSPRLRQSLKGAGVRIVVMVNGQESWTYML